jgi:exodeoxyribonuclease-3
VEPIILASDLNVIPEPKDARYPRNWVTDALFQPETQAKFREILNIGFNDALRLCDDSAEHFTFWDYQAGAWQKNNGIRIDHCLLSPQATDRLRGVRIHKETRSWDKPSDHVPVVIELDA